MTSDELLVAAKECGTEIECQDAWDKWNEHEAWLLRREQLKAEWDKATWCPAGKIFVCQDHWCRTSARNRQPPKRRGFLSGCMSRSAAMDGLGGMY